MSRINRVKQACCIMDGIKMMFNERWFGSINYLLLRPDVGVAIEEHSTRIIKLGRKYVQLDAERAYMPEPKAH